jgi:hypothetical protein
LLDEQTLRFLGTAESVSEDPGRRLMFRGSAVSRLQISCSRIKFFQFKIINYCQMEDPAWPLRRPNCCSGVWYSTVNVGISRGGTVIAG